MADSRHGTGSGTNNDSLSFTDVFDLNANGADLGDLNQYIKSIDSNNGNTEIQFKDAANGSGDGGKIILSGYDAGITTAANDIAALADVTVNIDVS